MYLKIKCREEDIENELNSLTFKFEIVAMTSIGTKIIIIIKKKDK